MNETRKWIEMTIKIKKKKKITIRGSKSLVIEPMAEILKVLKILSHSNY